MVTGSDISVLNSGSIRNEAKAGDLTYGELLSLLPYDNYIVVAEVKGSTILSMLEKLMSFLPKPDGQFPQVSGMKFTVRVATHQVSDVKILNSATQHYEPLNPDRIYTVATTKYCVTDGGLYNTLKGSKITWETKRTYNDIFIEFVTKNLGGHIGQQYAQPQGRINKL
jgi:2',3'-cyclic-nucleotide 2'-phosphodiesterase (5'-nucleotidase family)